MCLSAFATPPNAYLRKGLEGIVGLPWSDSLSAERKLEMWKDRAVVVVAVEKRRVERGRVCVKNDIFACGWGGCGRVNSQGNLVKMRERGSLTCLTSLSGKDRGTRELRHHPLLGAGFDVTDCSNVAFPLSSYNKCPLSRNLSILDEWKGS